MTRLIQALHALALALVCAILAPMAYEAIHLRPKVEGLVKDLDRTVLIVASAATNVEKASRAWEQSSKNQALTTSTAMSNVSAAAAELTRFISQTDKSVNSILLPTLSQAVDSQNAALLETQKDLQSNLAAAQKVLLDTDAQISSPDVKIALDNFAASSQNLSAATAEGAASMRDVHAALDYEIKQLEAPVTKAKVAWNFALNIIRHLYF